MRFDFVKFADLVGADLVGHGNVAELVGAELVGSFVRRSRRL